MISYISFYLSYAWNLPFIYIDAWLVKHESSELIVYKPWKEVEF